MRTEDLIEIAAKAAWRRDYPHGGSMYKSYDDLPHYDQELYRKEVMAIVTAIYPAPARSAIKNRKDMADSIASKVFASGSPQHCALSMEIYSQVEAYEATQEKKS